MRNTLRAKARQLGNGVQSDGFQPLVEEIAYVQWHRMLFARFLAENNLLIHLEHGVPVTLQECEELAPAEGEPDAWQLADSDHGGTDAVTGVHTIERRPGAP